MKKLLALDIDDTTLRRDGTLSEKNRLAIERAKSNGAMVVLVTGRSPKATLPVWKTIPASDICVCLGGAEIINLRSWERLSSIFIEPEHLRYALGVIHEMGLIAQIYRKDDVITEFDNQTSRQYMSYLNLGDIIIEPNVRSVLNEGITKLICFSEADKLDENIYALSRRLDDKLCVSASTNRIIEIHDSMANKGEGLKSLCKLMGIDISDSVAIGDSLIDLPMIKAAGVGIAVKNAHSELLKAADITAPDCDDDAVEWAVERYFC